MWITHVINSAPWIIWVALVCYLRIIIFDINCFTLHTYFKGGISGPEWTLHTSLLASVTLIGSGNLIVQESNNRKAKSLNNGEESGNISILHNYHCVPWLGGDKLSPAWQNLSFRWKHICPSPVAAWCCVITADTLDGQHQLASPFTHRQTQHEYI